MSQQQAVQPIVLKQENGEVVLKLVLENPKQDTQTLILQQPDGKEFTMSTDTTAIWSFVLAMVLAFILGISATVIAVWYGRKSFDLTKQSFDALIKQIESSEKIISDSNQKLIQAQNDLSQQQFIRRMVEDRLENFMQYIVDFLDAGNSLTSFLQTKRIYLGDVQVENIMDHNSIESIFHSDLLNMINNLRVAILKVSINLENDFEHHQELVTILQELDTFLNFLLKDIYPTTNNLVQNIQKFSFLHMRAYIYLADRYKKETLKLKAA